MSLPAEFVQKYQTLFGSASAEFLASFSKPVEKGFRINPHKKVTAEMQAKLADPVPYSTIGYYGQLNGNSLEHVVGAGYSQEPSAMFVGEAAKPEAGEKVLDLCAAPGGKSTHLLSYLNSSNLLVSNEINRKRVTALGENIERYGAKNAVITNETPAKLAKALPQFFDRILVDAPCSGEGMFRKDPDAMQYWSLDYPKECATRQREILTETVKMLKPGGHLIYSTCTFAPEEDEQMIAWLLQTYSQLKVVPIKPVAGMISAKPEWADNNPEIAGAVRLLPHLMRGEGHFVAHLQLAADPEATLPRFRPNRSQLSVDQQALWANFADELQLTELPGYLVAQRDQLFLVPAQWPNLTKVTVFRPGLHLGTFKKNRFEPSYSLALALQPDEAGTLTITRDQWANYVHGDTLTLSSAQSVEKGWYLLVCEGLPVGFGKLVGTTIKNFFPKGLRFAGTQVITTP